MRKRNKWSTSLKKKKGQSKTGKIMFALFFSTVILVILFSFMAMLSVKGPQTVYDTDLTITESLSEGFTTPSFDIGRGDKMLVYISNFYSSDGYSLVLMLQGVGVEWQRVASSDATFSHFFEESADYNFKLAINNFDPIAGAEITFHIKIILT